MKTPRQGTTVRPADDPPAAVGWLERWRQFWFARVDPVGLHALRVLAGLLFLAWLLPFAGEIDNLFGLAGWFDRQAYADSARMFEDAPQQLGWSFLFALGGSPGLLRLAYWGSIAVLAGFTLGVAPRLTGLLSWVIVVSFSVNPALEYEGDVLVGVLAFYLMLGCLIGEPRRLGQSWPGWLLAPGWPLDRIVRPAGEPLPSLGANLAVRLFQVHFAIIIVTTGLHKLQFGDWWAGVALWYPLTPPPDTTVAQARALAGSPESFLFFLSLAAYAVLAWQISFPVFAWRPRWRWLLLAGAAAGCVGALTLYKLPVIGPALVVGCLAYLSPQEWRRWLDRILRGGQAIRQLLARPRAGDERPAVRRSNTVGVGHSG